jgi:hypothetical protein
MGIPEHIDDFKAHYRMSRDTFYIVLENIQDTLIRNGKGPHEAVSPDILKGEQSMHHFSALLSLVKTQMQLT